MILSRGLIEAIPVTHSHRPFVFGHDGDRIRITLSLTVNWSS